MSKVERLNARVAKLLTVAVQEVLEVVRETVSEYQEKTARTQRENERLRRRLQELQEKQRKESFVPETGPPLSGDAAEKVPTSLEALPFKQEQSTETLGDSEQTPADIEQIIIKCDSPREHEEVPCHEMPAVQNDNITEDRDEDSVHFVACYRNTATAEHSSSRKSHRLIRKCKIETDCEEPSEARTSIENELFVDKRSCSEGSLDIQNSGLVGTQHSKPKHKSALEKDSPVSVIVDTSPTDGSHASLSGTAGFPYLTVKTQIKTEADADNCRSNSAPQRDDYVTAHFNGLGDEPDQHSLDQQVVAAAAASSSPCAMSYIPLGANAVQHDGLFLENGYEAVTQEAAQGSLGMQLNAGPLRGRGLGGCGGGGGGGVVGGRLPRPYTRHHPNHTGLPKRYCCNVCGRSFNHAGDFKKHKRVHTGEKPYACGVCGKRFSQSGYLTVHLRYHTGERPYSCSLCGRSFSHSSNFRKHQQTHIGQMMSHT